MARRACTTGNFLHNTVPCKICLFCDAFQDYSLCPHLCHSQMTQHNHALLLWVEASVPYMCHVLRWTGWTHLGRKTSKPRLPASHLKLSTGVRSWERVCFYSSVVSFFPQIHPTSSWKWECFQMSLQALAKKFFRRVRQRAEEEIWFWKDFKLIGIVGVWQQQGYFVLSQWMPCQSRLQGYVL